jgi:cytochrome c-type biogenesis protein CcmH
MELILLLACLVFAVIWLLVRPLLRPIRSAPERGHFDRIVYRDQLLELERDVLRGVLTETEAIGARLEITRRLLASATTPGPAAKVRNARSPVLASIIVLFAVGGTVALYASLGTPGASMGTSGRPDSTFALRSAAASEAPSDQAPTSQASTSQASTGQASGDAAAAGGHGDLAQAAVRLAAKLKADPSNADGWLLYARTAGSLRHWDAAVDAYRHAMALGRTGAEIQAGYGETLALQAEGIVTPAAHDAFVAALTADPKQDVARYYLGLAAGQAGEPELAINRFQGLLGDIPEDSPMREEIGKRIAEAAKAAGLPAPVLAKGTPAEAPDPETTGPDAAAMDAAAGMPEGDRKTMIAGMVAKLAARLEREPGDADGWMRLGRAYVVMGERDKAAEAYDRAVALKPGDPTIRLRAAEGLLAGLKPDDALPPVAVTLLRQVEVVSPDEPAVLWYLGIAAARDAHPTDAKRYWIRLLAKLPAEGEDTTMVKGAMAALKGG